MNKQVFLAELRQGLSGIPKEDLEERLTFYSEMIDDRMEEGLSEESAIAALGTTQSIIGQTLAEIPLSRLVKEKVKPGRKMQAWEISLLVLGSPIWLSLLIALLAVILSLYAVLWSVMIALWAIEGSLTVCAVAGVFACIVFLARGSITSGIAMLGAGLLLFGLSIFGFFGCKYALKGILALSGRIFIGIKSLFMKKEASA